MIHVCAETQEDAQIDATNFGIPGEEWQLIDTTVKADALDKDKDFVLYIRQDPPVAAMDTVIAAAKATGTFIKVK